MSRDIRPACYSDVQQRCGAGGGELRKQLIAGKPNRQIKTYDLGPDLIGELPQGTPAAGGRWWVLRDIALGAGDIKTKRKRPFG